MLLSGENVLRLRLTNLPPHQDVLHSWLYLLIPANGSSLRRELLHLENNSGPGRLGYSGVAIAPNNFDAVIEAGTPIARVGHSNDRVVSAYVSDSWIETVSIGQSARLALPGVTSETIAGKIVSISDDPVDELPPEIAVDRMGALGYRIE